MKEGQFVPGKKSEKETKESKTLRELLINKWTVLLGCLATAYVLNTKMSGGKHIAENTRQELKMSDDALSSKKQVFEELVAINHLTSILREKIRPATKDAFSVGEDAGEEDAGEGAQFMSGRYLIKEKIDADGTFFYNIVDTTLPSQETATAENLQKLTDALSNYDIEKDDKWHFNVNKNKKANNSFKVRVRAEGDGTFTVDSVCGFDDEVNVKNTSDLKEILSKKENINDLAEKSKTEGNEDKLIEYIKDLGFLSKP